MLTVKKAANKLSKYGMVLHENHLYSIKYKGFVIAFSPNGKNEPETLISSVMIRRENDHSDSQSDYCAWNFHGSIDAAIRDADRRAFYPTAEQVVASYRAAEQ